MVATIKTVRDHRPPCTVVPLSEAAQKVSSNRPDVNSEFCRPGDCQRLFGLKRGMVYELERRGLIRTVSLRQKGAARGCKLISVPSVRAYLGRLLEGGDQ